LFRQLMSPTIGPDQMRRAKVWQKFVTSAVNAEPPVGSLIRLVVRDEQIRAGLVRRGRLTLATGEAG